MHNALIGVCLDMARVGGPDAVILREATRRIGVAPNAAYRHFKDRDALLAAVCSAAQAEFARAIEAQIAQVNPSQDPIEVARASFHAVGIGYMRFAQNQPGLFRTAFWLSKDLQKATSFERRGESGRTPFELLCAALDDLVAVGILEPERRKHAEFLAWSAVHGLATLLIDGPLGELDATFAAQLEQRLVKMVERGM